MQRPSKNSPPAGFHAFAPSSRDIAIVLLLAGAALGCALYIRYGLIQNTPLGLACDAGEQSASCTVRLGFIRLFAPAIFGWTALIAALVQLWRPNAVAFGLSLVAACFGIVLYNTRLSSLAIALLLLSLARFRRKGPATSEARQGQAG